MRNFNTALIAFAGNYMPRFKALHDNRTITLQIRALMRQIATEPRGYHTVLKAHEIHQLAGKLAPPTPGKIGENAWQVHHWTMSLLEKDAATSSAASQAIKHSLNAIDRTLPLVEAQLSPTQSKEPVLVPALGR
jgi:hypothetical protein